MSDVSIMPPEQMLLELRERMKELSFLYDLATLLAREDLALDEILSTIVTRLPQAMLDPERALARIECLDKTFGPVIEGETLSAALATADASIGRILVGYETASTAEPPPPFLEDERRLLAIVAQQIGQVIARRRIDETARAHLTQLQAILEQAPIAIELVDLATGRFLESNPVSYNTLGYTREEMLGMSVADIQFGMTPEEIALLLSRLPEVGSAQFENQHRCKDGRILDVEVQVRVIEHEGRQTVVGIWRDVTEQKQADARLRMLSMAVEQSPNAVVITDLEARITYVNDAFVKAMGYQRAEVLGKNPRFLKSGKTPASTYRALWNALSKGFPWTGELINRTKHGQERIELATILPLRDPSGQIRHYVALKQDVTATKHMERELAQHRNHLEQLVQERTAELRLLLESTSDGIFGLDDKDRITFANSAAARLLGYTHPGRLVGRSAHETTHHSHPDGTDYPIETCPIRGSIRASERFDSDTEVFWRQDGTALPVAYSCVPLRRDGAAVGAVVSFQDITERKRAEAELRQAKEAAESASRAMSDFLANMSHEIRTPLNAIIGLTHLLQRDAIEQTQRERLGKVANAAHHLLGIINDILDLSKIEAGRLQLEQSDFELEPIIENVCGLMRERAAEKRLELLVDLKDLPMVLHGDGLRLGQILLNFLGNAIKFTETGRIILRGWTTRAAEGELIARFEVEDTGIGLSTEQRQRLFLPFEQADASTTRQYGGTGLGLAISRRLTELMRGRIGVDSELGQGSTFWIEVPFDRGHAERPPQRSQTWIRGRRVLVVDDLPEARETLASMLATFGVQVMVAVDGASALRLIADQDTAGTPFELALIDWQMPLIDGLQVGRRLQGLTLQSPPRALLVTAYGEGPDPAILAIHGFVSVLLKPLTASRLLDALHQAFAGARTTPRPTASDTNAIEQRLRQRAPRRILLVEDNAVNQEVAFDLLSAVDLEVDLAEDGQVALDKASVNTYDLILMDVQMPIMDGLTATRLLRERPEMRATPIIAMTANAFAEDREACLAAGMNEHVVKPVDPAKLYQVLIDWLPGGADTAAPSPAPEQGCADQDTGLLELSRSLATIEGLDPEVGLRFASRRPDLYARLLRTFIETRDASLLHNALTALDVETAKRAAHTLKGTAATLGAVRLRTQAAALEQGIAARATAPERLLELVPEAEVLGAELERLCAQLATVLPPRETSIDQTPPPASSLDPTTLNTFITRLDALLATDDLEAIDLVRHNRALLRQILDARSQDFERALDAYAFDDALSLLRASVRS